MIVGRGCPFYCIKNGLFTFIIFSYIYFLIRILIDDKIDIWSMIKEANFWGGGEEWVPYLSMAMGALIFLK